MRQLLAAPLGGRGKPVPAGLRPSAIGFFPARRRRDGAILERRAVAVAHRVEGRENISGELAGFLQHGLDHVRGEVAVEPLGQRGTKSRRVVERKGDVGNRRPVGHGVCSQG